MDAKCCMRKHQVVPVQKISSRVDAPSKDCKGSKDGMRSFGTQAFFFETVKNVKQGICGVFFLSVICLI